MGLEVPVARLIRYDIFVQDLKGPPGLARLGGPLFFSSKLLTLNGADKRLADQTVRFIVAKDLTYVALDEHFNRWTLGPSMWFTELVSTLHQLFHYWEDQGQPIHDLFGVYIKGRLRFLLLRPMDGGRVPWYGYSLFPRWIDRTFWPRSGSMPPDLM